MKKNIPFYPELRGMQLYDPVTQKYYPITGDAAGHLQVDIVSGGLTGLTDAELRATPVPVSGDLSVDVTLGEAEEQLNIIRRLVEEISISPNSDRIFSTLQDIISGRKLRVTLDGEEVSVKSAPVTAEPATSIATTTDDTQLVLIRRLIEEILLSPNSVQIIDMLGSLISSNKLKVTLGNEKVSVNVIPTTSPYPVKVDALPLPSGAALEGGNLAKLENFNSHGHIEVLNNILQELKIITYVLKIGMVGRAGETITIERDIERILLERILS